MRYSDAWHILPWPTLSLPCTQDITSAQHPPLCSTHITSATHACFWLQIYLAIDALLTGNGVVGTRAAIDEAQLIMAHVGQPGLRVRPADHGGVKRSPLFSYKAPIRCVGSP